MWLLQFYSICDKLIFHETNTLDDNFRIVSLVRVMKYWVGDENVVRGNWQQMIENRDYNHFVSFVIADVDE